MKTLPALPALIELDEHLRLAAIAAEEAAHDHPESARNFQMIMAMLRSVRDELDRVAQRPLATCGSARCVDAHVGWGRMPS
jgi:hypothetical protein